MMFGSTNPFNYAVITLKTVFPYKDIKERTYAKTKITGIIQQEQRYG